MCLAVPLEIICLLDSSRALVRQGKGSLEVDLSLLDAAPVVGDHVIVHAGFALDTLDLNEARERLALLRHTEIDAGR